MALTYSLRYKKLNSINKVVLEKEGEIVIDRYSFRLKGKGAQDTGEDIFFGDMKDLFIKDERITFSTYSKDKYILLDFSNLFDSFIRDFFRVRNQYLADNLFMKSGMLVHEYDCQAEIISVYGKTVPRGKCKIQFYEGSILIIPELKDCFSINLNFLKNHEFDEDEYVLRLFLENGQNIIISKLGTTFEDARSTLESILGKMYERAVVNFSEAFPGFNAKTLLKLIQKVKDGKFVPLAVLKKIDDELMPRIDELLVFGNPSMKETVAYLRKSAGDNNYYVSLSFTRKKAGEDLVPNIWFLAGLPDQNIVVLGQSSNPAQNSLYVYKIIMQQGVALEKLPGKVFEVEQALLTMKFDMDPLFKDRKDLKRTKYVTAIRKLSFMRLLRKSFALKIMAGGSAEAVKKLNDMFPKK